MVSAGVVLMIACVAHAKPARSEAPTQLDRGLVLTAHSAVVPLAKPTPATDYAQHRYARRIAVVIGISAYPDRPWPRLPAAASDARHMAALFHDMGFDQVETLTDEAATRAAMLELVEHKIPSAAADNDLVVMFFAGHGATAGDQGYIIPRDADGDLERTAISVQRIKESVLRMHARHAVFLMDACFSGSMLRRGDAGHANPLAYWQATERDRVVQIITAGGAEESAQESNGWGHFTHAVHDGLAGAADRDGDGVVTTQELADYADARVQGESKGRQHPRWGTMEGSGTVIFLDVRRLPHTTARPARVPIPALEAPLREIYALMDRHEWKLAEDKLRGLTVSYEDGELRLLLAEVYVEADVLGNERLIEQELDRAEARALNDEQRRRLLDLRERLNRALRRP